MQQLVKKALESKPWRDQVTESQLQTWQQKVASLKTEFQRTEVLHYVTLAHVQQGLVPLQAEYDYLVSQYQPTPSTSQPLRTPEDTFGENLVIRPCPKCGHRDTTSFVVQMRSADEPSSVMHACNRCSHTWKFR